MKIDNKYNNEWFEKQIEKCLTCPCYTDNKFKGCYACGHYEKECNCGHDCSEGDVIHKDKLKLCCADDCAMTLFLINKGR